MGTALLGVDPLDPLLRSLRVASLATALIVAVGLPTAVTLACGGGLAQWERLAPALARPAFRPYYSDDVAGAEIGGAVKNVLAIACGVVDGLGLGQNARAALQVADYGYVLENGRVVMDKPAQELLDDSDIQEFYLGLGGEGERSFRDVKHYKRRKRWLS